MKKILYLFTVLALFNGCSFLPEQPDDILLDTDSLDEIVYGAWEIQAISDAHTYGTTEWKSIVNASPALEFFVNGQYELTLDGQVIEQRAFAVVIDNGVESLQMGIPEGYRWEVIQLQENNLEIQRETENGLIKQRLRRK